MPTIHAQRALLPQGTAESVRVVIAGGRIAKVHVGVAPEPGDDRVGLIVPGVGNVHSHAFQRAMAGLAEVRGREADSFWTWREVMYRFALALSPDQMEAVAAQAYVEMLEAGFTRVGEFHYLHHDRDGGAYDDVAEMAARICAAAGATGISLTLLPVLYAHSGFGGTDPLPTQRRFVTGIDRFARLHEASRRHAAALDGAVVGVAPHSLRAVTPDELAVAASLDPARPVHIHAAEQTREVEDCLAWSGRRPVEWLIEHAGLDARWCLIHATHMTGDEARDLARSGATAGLCPITEANLGDGIFMGPEFRAAGGDLAVGTDSNVQIGLVEEMRQLEYSQRLGRRMRNVVSDGPGSTGLALMNAVHRGGARALGVPMPAIAENAAADLVAVDLDQPAFAAAQGDQVLDAWIFSAPPSIDQVWVAGEKLVQNGRHVRRDEIAARYVQAVRDLAAT
jgi:formiminoglutamate deiminase